jgi:hypothetical protein
MIVDIGSYTSTLAINETASREKTKQNTIYNEEINK